MADVLRRASAYYHKNGLRRSLTLLRKKFSGRVPWNIRSPAVASKRYLDDHQAAVPVAAAAPHQPAGGGEAGQMAALGNPTNGGLLFARPTVVIIGDLNLPQCKKYRVVQKCEALAARGFGSSFSHWQDVPRCTNLLQAATFVIFYRLTDGDLFRAYLREARRLGLGVAYDIDDPIFDAEIYATNRNLEFLSSAEQAQLVASSPGYLDAMKACDVLILSTPGMQAQAARRLNKPSYLWRNAVDSETAQAARLAEFFPGPEQDGGVVIGYASGSRAHEADFKEAEEAVLRILAEHEEARLVIVGYHQLSPRFKAFAPRITQHGFGDYENYVSILSGFDINIVPLLHNGFNACKSAIRFLDAASVGVPTVASRVGDFVNVVEDAVTGFLAGDEKDWYRCLDMLVTDGARRKAAGAAARAAAAGTMGAAETARRLDPALTAMFGGLQ